MLGFAFRGFTQEGKRASTTLSSLPEKAQKKKSSDRRKNHGKTRPPAKPENEETPVADKNGRNKKQNGSKKKKKSFKFTLVLHWVRSFFVFFSTPVPSSCTRSADHEVVSSSSPAAVRRSPWPPSFPRPLPSDHSCLAGLHVPMFSEARLTFCSLAVTLWRGRGARGARLEEGPTLTCHPPPPTSPSAPSSSPRSPRKSP